MKKLQFSILIHSTKEKVWEALWKDENYRKWTSVFQEGSFAESDFQEGSQFRFLTAEKNGVWGEIAEMIPYKKMYFLHKGEVLKGENQPVTYDSDAIENYDLEEIDGSVELSVTMNAPEDYIGYFANTLPKALEEIKKTAEL